MTPIDHANEVIASVRQKTDRAILFYSCGKDSEVLLDLMAPHFKEIVCVFMYFVKGLDHIDNYLRAVKARYANVTILQVPHWTLTRVLRCGLYCIPNPNVKLLSLKDVDESVRMKTGISYSFYGMKQSDGMNRCLMLRGYENEAISNTNKVYPLSKWKKSDVMAYIKAKKLPEPISYNKNKSQGLTFLPEVFDYLRRHYPQDLEKIYKVFYPEIYYCDMTKRKEQQPKYKQSETVVIKRSQINFAPYNPRKEDPEVIKKLKKNFKTVGYLGGIVWNQLSSYLVSGHKRVQTLDIINNYDGTPETDYEIKVEAVELDDKTEREQNIFMNSPSAMGEFDMEKIKVLVPEIDYKAAGLSEADMNIYGISVMQDEISSELSDTLGDFEEIQRPFEERKAAVKEMKEQIRQQAEQKAEDIESYVMLNFKSYRAKSSFMLRFGFRPDDKIIPGEMFSDMVERVE